MYGLCAPEGPSPLSKGRWWETCGTWGPRLLPSTAGGTLSGRAFPTEPGLRLGILLKHVLDSHNQLFAAAMQEDPYLSPWAG